MINTTNNNQIYFSDNRLAVRVVLPISSYSIRIMQCFINDLPEKKTIENVFRGKYTKKLARHTQLLDYWCSWPQPWGSRFVRWTYYALYCNLNRYDLRVCPNAIIIMMMTYYRNVNVRIVKCKWQGNDSQECVIPIAKKLIFYTLVWKENMRLVISIQWSVRSIPAYVIIIINIVQFKLS